MIRLNNKLFPTLLAIIALFITSFYLSSNRITDSDLINTQLLASDKKQNQQESSVKQKIEDDFENAFIKQYTPLIGCEDLFAESPDARCELHLEEAKNQFKDEFIKERGLPKNTFEEIKLSFAE